jgi:serine/threonine-protein kinase
MSEADPLLDTILGDDFRVVRQIGFGGYGRIYLAEQLSVGKRKVALKVLHAMHGDQAAAVAGLKREAAFLALLRSPCFPRILRTGTTPLGLPYFAMELVIGKTLDATIRESGPLSLPNAALVLDSVLDSVAELHARDIIHRDIKTGNIVLEQVPGVGLKVRVLDLGSARPAYEKDPVLNPSRPLSVGSPPFVAPETAKSGITSDLSDIYSLGAVAFEVLCGVRALHLKDTSPESYVQYLLSDKPIPTYRVGTLNPEVPEAVEAVVQKALSREPRQRYASVVEFRQALLDVVLPLVGASMDVAALALARAPGAATPVGTTPVPAPEAERGGRLGRLIPLRFRKP